MALCQIGPLLPAEAAPKPATRLNPLFAVEGRAVVMVTQFEAAVLVWELGERAGSLLEEQDAIGMWAASTLPSIHHLETQLQRRMNPTPQHLARPGWPNESEALHLLFQFRLAGGTDIKVAGGEGAGEIEFCRRAAIASLMWAKRARAASNSGR